jgi:protein-S-isoprenylcysteine O-methyltransferase Ste14
MVYIIIRAPYDKNYKKAGQFRTIMYQIDKPLLFLLSIGLLLMPLLWIFTPFLAAYHIPLPLWARSIGIILSMVSLIYFWQIHKTLGINWSPTLEIRQGHELIKDGPYKNIRHPMYAQIWMWSIAQVFIVSNSIAGFSGITAWAILYFIRVPKEEKMMKDYFGEEYISYMKQTGRILPKLHYKNKLPKSS